MSAPANPKLGLIPSLMLAAVGAVLAYYFTTYMATPALNAVGLSRPHKEALPPGNYRFDPETGSVTRVD